MAGTALTLPFPSLPEDDPRGWLRKLIRGLARTRGNGRARSVAELQALTELEHGEMALGLDAWEGYASAVHRPYRSKRLCPYIDVVPEQAARAVGVRLVYQAGLWRTHFDPATRIATLAPRADAKAQAFETFHEISEATCHGGGALHADVQWVTVALMVEHDIASSVLRRFGLRRGVAALARSHRRVRRCFLWARLAMIAAAG